jgi:O-antigen ligase
MSRIDNWKLCWQLALDRPLTGGGFKFIGMETMHRYSPQFAQKYGIPLDTHNIFMGILAGHGFPALTVFVLMIVTAYVNCYRIRGIVPKYANMAWAGNYGNMVQVSLIGWIVNGMFVNMEYFELPYHLIAVVVAVKLIIREAQREPAEYPTIAAA